MRLSEWRKAAPTEGAMNDRVLAVVGPVLADLGAERDPECWVAWGEDPDLRYSLLAPTLAGLITAAIRFTSPEDGPRVIGKLVRWSKVAVSELGVDAGGGHRMVAVQVDNLVLKGMDQEADRICDFVRILIAGVDDRLQMPAAITPVRGVAPVVAASSTARNPRVPVGTVTKAPAPVVGPRLLAAPAAAPTGGAPAGAEPRAKVRPAPKTTKAAKPTAPKAASSAPAKSPRKVAPKAPGKSAVPTLVPPAPPAPAAPGPAAPVEALGRPEQASPPTPIADRAAARHVSGDVEPAVAPKTPEVEPESEPDRSGWISPHPIEDQVARKAPKPRTWRP